MIALIAVGVVAVLIICFADVLAPRVKAAPPLLLVLIGLALSLIPAVSGFEVEPEIVLQVILPPLLYAAAVAMPAMSFKREMPAITGLSVLLVVASSLLLGLLFQWVVPDIGFGWGAALGAILSPTDAVATSIIKGRGVPDRVVTILEGESLLNDATALVILSTAIGASAGGFSVLGAAGSFVYSVAVALVIGIVVGFGNFWVRRRITNPTVNTVLSFTLPFIASAPAELLGSSGLVAAVVAGLVTGFRGPRELPPAHRMISRSTWASIQMLLEGAIFLTMGLQLSSVLERLSQDSLGIASGLAVAVIALVVTLLARTVFITIQLRFLRRRARRGEDMQPRIDAMRERLETGQRMTLQHLDALERARARVGGEDPTPEQLREAYMEELRELAESGDELAQKRLELGRGLAQKREELTASAADLSGPGVGWSQRRNRRRMEKAVAHRARRVADPGARGPRHRTASQALPDPERLERYSTRLRRASADIGYLVSQPLGAREGAVLVWAGMRGAITVAAAQTLPEGTPHRSLLIFIAFAVATLSLLVQGGTIGPLVRRLFSAEPDPEREKQEAEQRSAILALLETGAAEAETSLEADVPEKTRQLAILRTQRETLLDARDDGLFDADTLENALAAVDASEIALDMRGGPEG